MILLLIGNTNFSLFFFILQRNLKDSYEMLGGGGGGARLKLYKAVPEARDKEHGT